MPKIITITATVAWLTIEAMVLINPSSTIGYELGSPGSWLFFLASPLFIGASLAISSRASRSAAFFISCSAAFFALVALSWWAGYVVHRDFFTFPAQLVMIYAALSLAKLDDLDIVKRKPETYSALYAGAMVMFGLWILWLMLMSYAIVARTEPRWIESSAYNLVNGLIGILLALSASTLRNRAKRVIRVEMDAILLDRRDISSILSPQEGRLVSLFLERPGSARTCDDLLQALTRDYPGFSKSAACGRCRQAGWNATKCPAFRNLKNRILDAKKFLELLQIGTIVPVSENVRDIKLAGWRLRLFDDVRFEPPRKKAHVRQ